ncbi:group II intron maturase-specific domain-containing protein [Ktedonobacter robiniae]|uniref:group II intron maturase-specific domain-containing protein n=1 Tax=Ktedonobacter robiniae TaxID=2778365 RepID=UPI0022A78715|nr:group II intron maturase-specific domain-containing protein [Ktedonobacter robiniae]
MTPSKEAVKRHTHSIKVRLRSMRNISQERLIMRLNPVIRGWSRYYRSVVAANIFSRCDHVLYYQLEQWARHKHPTRGRRWIHQRYWRKDETRNWIFSTPEKQEIRRHNQTSIQRHTKVKGEASPYDGNLLYWSQRLKHHPMLKGTLARLLQKQQGKCRWCELYFRPGDLIEIDHITPKSEGGGEELNNKFALHLHCHDSRHAKHAAKSIDNNDHTLSS